MARVPQPARAHPERTTIEIGAGSTAIALGAILMTVFVSAPHHWQHKGDLAALALGLVFAVLGTYVFAQFYVAWLPSLPEPRERKPALSPAPLTTSRRRF
jgi:Mg/Co/Ni transporter MgtE